MNNIVEVKSPSFLIDLEEPFNVYYADIPLKRLKHIAIGSGYLTHVNPNEICYLYQGGIGQMSRYYIMDITDYIHKRRIEKINDITNE